mmetsp:Transcript_955/g.1969  ORF Transcript_955/g.1969 Transcript_955/m.1969 type:complete len:212 (-) Transcript_955:344-979(-)
MSGPATPPARIRRASTRVLRTGSARVRIAITHPTTLWWRRSCYTEPRPPRKAFPPWKCRFRGPTSAGAPAAAAVLAIHSALRRSAHNLPSFDWTFLLLIRRRRYPRPRGLHLSMTNSLGLDLHEQPRCRARRKRLPAGPIPWLSHPPRCHSCVRAPRRARNSGLGNPLSHPNLQAARSSLLQAHMSQWHSAIPQRRPSQSVGRDSKRHRNQ